MTPEKDTRIEFRLPIVCMIEAHGPLMGYQNTDGGICVRACDKCLDAEAENAKANADSYWRYQIRGAL